MNPKVCIGIPAYKPEFLEEAIASVLAQTFEDWELIVVDDCSPGDIKGIVGKFTDPRIRYYRNEQNIGAEDPSYNWDRCVSYARGEFFCLLCDDDMYHPTFLEEMLKLAEQFPDCNVFRARAQTINRQGEIIDKYPSSPLWESCEDYIWHKTHGVRHQTISEWMLRIQHLLDCGGYLHFPCAWAADVVSIYCFCFKGGIASSYKTLVSFSSSGLNISTHSEKNVIPKLNAFLLEEEETIKLIKEKCMDPKLLRLVKKRKEYEVHSLLMQIKFSSYVKTVFLYRRKYGIRWRTVITDLVKRLL